MTTRLSDMAPARDPDLLADLGFRIQFLRQEIGLTQVELATRVGTSTWSISRWERGHVGPHISFIVALANALGCTTDWLVGRTA